MVELATSYAPAPSQGPVGFESLGKALGLRRRTPSGQTLRPDGLPLDSASRADSLAPSLTWLDGFSAQWLFRHNGSMDLENAVEELYRIAPTEFTAARGAMASEAREEGERELASSLKKLRKPSVGAWLANLLVLEQPRDVELLVNLGAELRSPKGKLEGEKIRSVTKEKGDTIAKLLRDAGSKAAREGQNVSAAASQDLEATLDAAFADPQAAQTLLEGRLVSGLQYSGLGFGPQPQSGPLPRTKGHPSRRASTPEAEMIAARRSQDKALHEADQANADVEKAKKAVAEARQELTRLKSAEMQAVRRSKEAHAIATAANEKLKKLRRT